MIVVNFQLFLISQSRPHTIIALYQFLTSWNILETLLKHSWNTLETQLKHKWNTIETPLKNLRIFDLTLEKSRRYHTPKKSALSAELLSGLTTTLKVVSFPSNFHNIFYRHTFLVTVSVVQLAVMGSSSPEQTLSPWDITLTAGEPTIMDLLSSSQLSKMHKHLAVLTLSSVTHTFASVQIW